MKARQKKQDENALASSPGVMVQRSAAKASVQYKNESWDLVDAEGTGKVKVAEMKKDDLPEKMKKMNPKEREKYLKNMLKKREELKLKIKELKKNRDKYVLNKRKEISGKDSLDSAIISAIKEQAKKKDFKFKKK